MVMHRLADDITQVIRLNPIPWLFAPGVAFTGYLFGGLPGAAKALAAWIAIVLAATLWVIVRRHFRSDDAGR